MNTIESKYEPEHNIEDFFVVIINNSLVETKNNKNNLFNAFPNIYILNSIETEEKKMFY